MDCTNKNKYSFLNAQCENPGMITACKKCSGLVCCGAVTEGGIIEPPFLTKQDILQVEYFTGIKKEQFTFRRKNPVTKKMVFIMRTFSEGGCIFFDKDTGRCQIFLFRPMDCRLFPLDIEKRKGQYFWALYKFNRCNIYEEDLAILLEYRKEALQILGDKLADYATYPVPGMRKVGYKILMKL